MKEKNSFMTSPLPQKSNSYPLVVLFFSLVSCDFSGCTSCTGKVLHVCLLQFHSLFYMPVTHEALLI